MSDRAKPGWVWFLTASLLLAASAKSLAAEALGKVSAVANVGMTVAGLDRSMSFYEDVLGFSKVAERMEQGTEFEALTGLPGAKARVAQLRLGDEMIELTEFESPRGSAMPADSRANDRWFQHIAIIVSDMDAAYRKLRSHHVLHASSGPQRLPDWNEHAAGIQAFYFRDPDGHYLEILQFPPDKGDKKWHREQTGLFLGIDHTAIVVRDTDESLKFYRDRLGLKVVGGSENYGPEQDQLNHVFGARLQITTLRADSGPGIELLEYISPADGRPRPADTRPNDILNWQTTVVAVPVGARLVSTGDGTVERRFLGDPDGHVLLFESHP